VIKSKAQLLGYAREAMMIVVMIVGILAGRSTLADHYLAPSG